MSQYAFFFDETRCIDCRACSVACRDWNDIEPGAIKWLRILGWEVGAFPEVRLHHLFAPCYHCAKPLCQYACPTNAIRKEEKYGAVLVNSELCNCRGQRKCWLACPYGAPQFADDNPETKMSKCNMCYDRLEHGQQPVCVMSCPTRALDFGPLEKIVRKYGNIRTLAEMPSPHICAPSIVFKPRSERKKVIPYDTVRAVELMCKLEGQTASYESPNAITDIPPGAVKRDRLVLKPPTTHELLRVSRNDE